VSPVTATAIPINIGKKTSKYSTGNVHMLSPLHNLLIEGTAGLMRQTKARIVLYTEGKSNPLAQGG
jgi:hypothetical protein